MAQDICRVTVAGNLTKDLGSDPNGRDFGYTQGGMCIATISIANNRGKKQQDGTWGTETSYFDCKLFGKTAENLKPYLTKGQKVFIDGVLKQERWTDKEGKNQSKVVIYVNELELAGGKKEDNGQQSSYAQQYEQQNQNPFSQPSGTPLFKPAQKSFNGNVPQGNTTTGQPQQQYFNGEPFDENIPF